LKRKLRNFTPESTALGMLLAAVGGFLDAYTFVCRGGVFANAQTGNLVLIGVQVYTGHYWQAFLTTVPIFAFVLGVLLVEWLREHHSKSQTRKSEKFFLLLEMLVLFFVGFIPATVPPALVTVLIAFVSSVQIASFKRLVDSPYSTTMCTGNLRSATEFAYRAFHHRDKKAAANFVRYSLILLWFVIGSFLGAMLTLWWGVKAVWVSVVILGIALGLLLANPGHAVPKD
jgi:uncharacterized membrane protein YoaK (UPF0700 family)